jgi:hypothetical protein
MTRRQRVLSLLVIRFLGRGNPLFYGLAGFLIPCGGDALKLASQGAAWYVWNGILVLGVMVLVLIWVLVEGAGINKLSKALKLKDLKCTKIGEDVLIEGYAPNLP